MNRRHIGRIISGFLVSLAVAAVSVITIAPIATQRFELVSAVGSWLFAALALSIAILLGRLK